MVIAALIAPPLLLYAFSIFIPIGLSMVQSLTDASSMNPGSAKMIGFANYGKILIQDHTFWVSTLHAVILGACYVFLQHPLAILTAVLVDKTKARTDRVLRTIFFLPGVISIAVTTMMWKNLYNQQYGLANQLLKLFGLGRFQTDWLGNPHTAFPALLLMILWQGFSMGFLLYYSGVKRIPADIYEAASIDGASGFRLAWQITVPLLSPIIRIAVTMGVVNALKTMEAVYISTSGGPGDQTEFVADYMYRVAFQNYQWGYANALAVTFLVMCLITAGILNKALRRDVGEF